MNIKCVIADLNSSSDYIVVVGDNYFNMGGIDAEATHCKFFSTVCDAVIIARNGFKREVTSSLVSSVHFLVTKGCLSEVEIYRKVVDGYYEYVSTLYDLVSKIDLCKSPVAGEIYSTTGGISVAIKSISESPKDASTKYVTYSFIGEEKLYTLLLEDFTRVVTIDGKHNFELVHSNIKS